MEDLPFQASQPTAPHTHTVVFLHGRGDNATDFARAFNYWRNSENKTLQKLFPSIRWVYPQAPIIPSASFPGQVRPQWFDVWNVLDFSEEEDLQAVGLRQSVSRLRELLGREATMLSGRWDKVILAGISQGAATSVHTLLNLPRDCLLGGFIGVSCRMPFPGKTLLETRKVLDLAVKPDEDDDVAVCNTPILLEHCVDDPVVLVAGGRNLRNQLEGYGAHVTWKEYPDGEHWFNSPTGADDAVRFLGSIVGDQGQASGAMDLS